MTDTVGFIRKLPHGLVEAFASTLEETLAGDLDPARRATPPPTRTSSPRRSPRSRRVLDEIGADELPRLLVLNKIDRCDEVTRRRLRNRHAGAVQVSAETGEGIDDLSVRDRRDHFAGRFERVELLVPFERGEVLGELYDLGSPIEREEEAEGVRVRAHLPRGHRRALRRVPRARAGARRGRRRMSELPVVLVPSRTRDFRRGRTPTMPGSTCARSRTSRSRPASDAACARACASRSPTGHAGLVLPRSGLALRAGPDAAEQPRADRCRATAATST